MELKINQHVQLENGKFAKVCRILGEGAQGIVYEVLVGGSTAYALKYYTSRFRNNKMAVKLNLQRNISMGAIDERFIWPITLTKEDRNGNFGYLMPLIPKQYSSFSRFLNNEVNFKNTETVIIAALNILEAFKQLHRQGLCFHDLNNGSIYCDYQNGDVLICDADNITPADQMNPAGIIGKLAYMAPEVVCGIKNPCTLTDLHSLSVILFMLFVIADPFLGKKVLQEKIITQDLEKKIYGQEAIFIHNPKDASNRPAASDYNAIHLWPRLPHSMQDAFCRVFVDGVKDPSRRLPETEWEKILIKYLSNLLICPCCGSEHMLYKFQPGTMMQFACKHSFSYPRILHLNNFQVPLLPGKKLLACYLSTSESNIDQVFGEVIVNKKDPSIFGIRNLSNEEWKFSCKDGTLKTIKHNDVVPIVSDMEIKFGKTTGLVEKK